MNNNQAIVAVIGAGIIGSWAALHLVESVESTPGAGARIRMQSGITGKTETSGFDTAVVCAGPWTSKLLPQLAGHLRSLRIPVTYWRDSGNRPDACRVRAGPGGMPAGRVSGRPLPARPVSVKWNINAIMVHD